MFFSKFNLQYRYEILLESQMEFMKIILSKLI